MEHEITNLNLLPTEVDRLYDLLQEVEDEIRKQGEEDGYERGYSDGHYDGSEEGAKQGYEEGRQTAIDSLPGAYGSPISDVGTYFPWFTRP
jgi:flagellar biosynthesis/type III secretory pathway protein FliH